ncbi:hypothetical protein B0H14DRAFT_3883262 [Mycena olivaceomarginata]|nr:hypothetical protein B0H14DRAFT_3883262 [Mycena olivaceomarginata]
MPSPRFIVRLAILVTVSLFALISMSLAAALIASASQDGPFLDIALVTPTLAIVVAILTLLTAPLMIALEIVRPGAYFTSMIIFEILWLGFLSVMWLASGAAQAVDNIVLTAACTVDSSDDFDGFSDNPPSDDSLQTICGEAPRHSGFRLPQLANLDVLYPHGHDHVLRGDVAQARSCVDRVVANAPLSAPASAEKGPIPRSYNQVIRWYSKSNSIRAVQSRLELSTAMSE